MQFLLFWICPAFAWKETFLVGMLPCTGLTAKLFVPKVEASELYAIPQLPLVTACEMTKLLRPNRGVTQMLLLLLDVCRTRAWEGPQAEIRPGRQAFSI